MSIFNEPLKNKIKLLFLSIVSIFLLLLAIVLIIYFISDSKKVVESEIFFYEDKYTINPYDYRVKVDKNKDYSILESGFNWRSLLTKKYSVVYNEYLNNSGRSIAVFEIYRDNIFSTNWKYREYKMNQITDTSLPETLSLVSKYDITTDFPGKEKYNITNYSALSESEIQQNQQKLEEQNQIDQANEEYKKYLQTTYGSLLKPYTEILELVKTDNLTPQQIATNKQLASTKITSLQTELQQIQIQLNNNQNYTLPNNVTITPTQDTKDYIQQFIDEMVKIKGENGIQ